MRDKGKMQLCVSSKAFLNFISTLLLLKTNSSRKGTALKFEPLWKKNLILHVSYISLKAEGQVLPVNWVLVSWHKKSNNHQLFDSKNDI